MISKVPQVLTPSLLRHGMVGQEPHKQYPLHFKTHTLPPPDYIIAPLARNDPDVAKSVVVAVAQARRLSHGAREGYSKTTPVLFAFGGKFFGAIAAYEHRTNFNHPPRE